MRKKRIFAGVLTSAMAATILMSTAVPASAALAPQKIIIEGASSVRVGSIIELDSEIYPDDDLVNDGNIVWSSQNTSVAKVLNSRGDDTKVKGVKVGTAKITVQISGTSIKATKTIKVKKAYSSSQVTSDKKKLKKYKKKLKTIRKQIANTAVPSSYAARRSVYLKFERKLDAIDNKLDVIDDRWDDRVGSTARTMQRKIKRVENYLDSVEDYLEYKFDWHD